MDQHLIEMINRMDEKIRKQFADSLEILEDNELKELIDHLNSFS